MKALTIIIAVVLLAAVVVFLKLERFSAQREKLKQCFKGGHKCAKTEGASSVQAASAAPETKPPAAQEKPAAQAQAQAQAHAHAHAHAHAPSAPEAPMAEVKVSAEETRPATAAAEKAPTAAAEPRAAGIAPIPPLAPPRIDLGVKHCLPQDSILRRHFLATLRAALEAEMGPRPSDSILQRHYDSTLENRMCSCLTDESVAALQCAAKPCAEPPSFAVTAPAPAPEAAPAPTSTPAPAAKPAEAVKQPEIKPAADAPAVHAASGVNGYKTTVPQDSILRRHFMTTLRTDIESAAGPRPTDSVLQRHYDGLIAAKLNQRLTEL